ncbi:MAG: peptidoglycan-binding protein [Rhodobacteraceae bacterium]|nr:peptidoglycan-binding protein [Paracoccaceae bacterium]
MYDWATKQVIVAEAKRSWHTESYMSSPLATPSTLVAASKHGINLDEAESGMCFHEHYHQPQFTTTEEQVLLSEASEEITSLEAEYETVTKKILTKEASTKLIEIPAEYDFISEQVIDKPAHQIWKKGNGPIQKLDDATGEIMCLVDVPATYKTVTNRVMKSPAATTKEIEDPAEYKTVHIKELIRKPTVRTTSIPAKYGTVTKEVLLKNGEYVWHEIHDLSDSKQTHTGNKICLIEKPAKYETVRTKVVVIPATHQKIDIPAKYETVSVQKLVKEAREVKTELPAQFKTITHQQLVKEGYMEWRSILCETNMTQGRISKIQTALAGKGYYSGKIDGVVGTGAMSAVNAFQRDNQLPIDKYLNIETIKELNISTN